jgi:RNA polymerase sigma factor (TIGR02999 family)
LESRIEADSEKVEFDAMNGRSVASETQTEVTQILQEWSAGDEGAPARLMPLAYQELRWRAAEYLRHERADHTLQATALVHEVYLKMVDQSRATWKNQAHFFTVAAQLMRRILVQHAREHNRDKRGGKLEKLYLDQTKELCQEARLDFGELDDALKSFATTFPRESQVVEMRFFAGMEARAIAEVLHVSAKTVLRDWNFAKVWLCRELTQQHGHG